MTLPASLFLDERPLAQAIAPPPEPPGDEPQSLVLAVEQDRSPSNCGIAGRAST